MSAHLSRDQRVVLALLEPKGGRPEDTIDAVAKNREVRARARALPTMILRHGLMLTLEYLDGKGPEERQDENGTKPNLAVLLRAGLRAAVPGTDAKASSWPKTSDLAAMPLLRSIAMQDAAVGVATWIKRMVEARDDASGTASSTAGGQEPGGTNA